MEQQGIQNVLRCLPQQVRSRIQQLTPSEQAQIQEIRLRAERPRAFCCTAEKSL